MASVEENQDVPMEGKNVDAQNKDPKKGSGFLQDRPWTVVVLCLIGFAVSLYVFLVGLQMMGDAFKCLGGRGAGKMFTAVKNPISGLMTGVLATVMVQSSSTSTSIVVGLVGAETISVKTAIPIIMGANVGTSVTSSIVSMGQVGDRIQLQRAFGASTAHGMFNFLCVLTLMPIELIVGALEGEGGPLYWLTKEIAEGIMGGSKGDKLFTSPTKAITGPVSKLVISNNKYIISALSLGEPTRRKSNVTDAGLCANATRRLEAVPEGQGEALRAQWREQVAEREDASTGAGKRSLLSRRLSTKPDCSHYYCVSKSLDKNFKKISSTAYKKKLTKCSGYLVQPSSPCSSGEKCYLDAGKYWDKYVVDNKILKGGFAKGAGDVGGGIISLIISLILLTGGLFCLVKCLHILLVGKAKRAIKAATKLPDPVALLVGAGITILVQSSSVTTSALTPLAGMGTITLEKMYPLTLGANIGTTVTALLASIATFTPDAVHIALCHLFFNIIGVLIWFFPPMRRIPIGAARLLGLYASFYRLVPLVYILTVFVAIPGICLGVAATFDASLGGGLALLAVLLLALAAFEFWWLRLGGCYRVLSREARQKATDDLAEANAEIAAEDASEAGAAGRQVEAQTV